MAAREEREDEEAAEVPVPKRKKATDRGGSNWDDNEVLAFIEIWSDETIQAQLEGRKRNTKVYEKMARIMAEKGFTRTVQQCRNKLKALKTEYKKVRDNNNTSG